jgi:hypothetical protein
MQCNAIRISSCCYLAPPSSKRVCFRRPCPFPASVQNLFVGVSFFCRVVLASVSVSKTDGAVLHVTCKAEEVTHRSHSDLAGARGQPAWIPHAHTERQIRNIVAQCFMSCTNTNHVAEGERVGVWATGGPRQHTSLPILPQARVCVRNRCEAPTRSEEDNRISGPGLQTTTTATTLCSFF